MPSIPAPRTIRILGQKVRTYFVKDVPAAVLKKDALADTHLHEGLAGYAAFHRGQVYVLDSQSDDQLIDTWLHEVLHILLIHIGHDSEELAGRLSPVLLDFLRRNPKAVAFLMQRYYL